MSEMKTRRKPLTSCLRNLLKRSKLIRNDSKKDANDNKAVHWEIKSWIFPKRMMSSGKFP